MTFFTYGAILIPFLAYAFYRFKRRISPDIPYAGEESLLARLRAPMEFGTSPIDYLVKQRKKLGDIFCVDLFIIRFVFFLGPEGNRVFFRSPENILSFLEPQLMLLGPFAPKGIDAQLLESKSKTMYVGFTKPELLQGYSQLGEGLTDEFFQKWSSADSVPLFESFSSLIYAFLLVIILGDEFYRTNGDEMITLLLEFEKCISSPILQLLPHSLWRFTYPGSHGLQAQKRLNDLISALVGGHFERKKQKGLSMDDPSFIAFVCQHMDDEFIHLLGFWMPLILLAGHINLARIIPWFFLHARTKKGAIERCRAEIEIGSIMDRSATPFVEACLRETGRLYSAGNVMRCVPSSHPEGFITLMGHRVPAGTIVSCSLAATHRDPSLFEEPESWKPERFLEDNGKKYSQWFQRLEFVQFGVGVHTCPGEKLARLIFFDNILKTWLSKYDIEVVDGLRDNVGLDNVGVEAAWMEAPAATPPMKGDVQVRITMRTQ